jgi:hypothetical protein
MHLGRPMPALRPPQYLTGRSNGAQPTTYDRIGEPKATRDQARLDAERAEDAIDRAGPTITPQTLKTFARTARKRMRTDGGGYRRARKNCASWDLKACSCARWSLFQGQKQQVWRARFCTEVARSERFELPTLGFEVRCSIQLSYERLRGSRLPDLARRGYPKKRLKGGWSGRRAAVSAMHVAGLAQPSRRAGSSGLA